MHTSMHSLDSALLYTPNVCNVRCLCTCVPLSWDTRVPRASQWLLQDTLAAGREGIDGKQTFNKLQRPLILDWRLCKEDDTHTVQTTMMFCDVMARVANLIVL